MTSQLLFQLTHRLLTPILIILRRTEVGPGEIKVDIFQEKLRKKTTSSEIVEATPPCAVTENISWRSSSQMRFDHGSTKPYLWRNTEVNFLSIRVLEGVSLCPCVTAGDTARNTPAHVSWLLPDMSLHRGFEHNITMVCKSPPPERTRVDQVGNGTITMQTKITPTCSICSDPFETHGRFLFL